MPLALVNRIRGRVAEWRSLALRGEGGVTRTTMELLAYWRREGRQHRLFFAQLEAAETIIFLNEARPDFLQGIDIPLDEPSAEAQADGYRAFRRYACKMATGAGKTTVMAMLAAWSILNKVNNRADGRFSDAVLVVCPNVTIRSRLAELDPQAGEASLYRTARPDPPTPDARPGERAGVRDQLARVRAAKPPGRRDQRARHPSGRGGADARNHRHRPQDHHRAAAGAT